MNSTTHNSQPSPLNSLRAEIYRILSECFKEPCLEFAEDVARGRLYEQLARCFSGLGITLSLEGLKMSGEPMEVLQALKEQYYPLFVGPFPPFALPVESVYKEWAREGETPLISPGGKGMLMGDPAIDMLKRYQASGIEIPREFKDMPDHLSLLLEYMALLCENGDIAEQYRFVQDHLNWVSELRGLVYECSNSSFYRAVADATEALVAHEQQRLGTGENSRVPLDQAIMDP